MKDKKKPQQEKAEGVSKITTKLGYTAKNFKQSIADHVVHTFGKDEYTTTKLDWYKSVALSIRDRLMSLWSKTQQDYYNKDAKRVYYLSLEFLMGRSLSNGAMNLDVNQECKDALKDLGQEIEEIEEMESDAGLGNGGLGRLAACFLDSMATLRLPGYGYGLRYEYGIFSQSIKEGKQIETPDHWLQFGNAWEIERPENLYPVKFGGSVREFKDAQGHVKYAWLHDQEVMAMAYDTPVPGYNNNVVNTLRLWAAKSSEEFDFAYFNHGNYIQAVEDKNVTENITRVLYPNDNISEGKELRIKQQYFFVSASLQDIIRRYKKDRDSFDEFPKKVAIQLNDTHPALAIPELMRVLMDEEDLCWDKAWDITQNTFAYTNHTIMPEALEKWPVKMFEDLLPRHLQIICEINRRFLYKVAHKYPGNQNMIQQMSLIEEGKEKQIRMAHLAIVGSHSVNGVAKLHSELIKKTCFSNFTKLYPTKFNNKTNGITPRRWLKGANPLLSKLISKHIGKEWVSNLENLKQLLPLREDAEFRANWDKVKKTNKETLAKIILKETGVKVSTDSLFDVQVKRMHEYKRQLLNVLHVIYLYRQIKQGKKEGFVPRTVIFGGKAAPGYYKAKLIIRLINAVAEVVNNDPDVLDLLKVVFIPNYGVSLAEKIIPAADLSEHISTAGMEASGTSNMKFALNGSLIIGTLDGANIEIKEEVGSSNIYIFGLTAEQVQEHRKKRYNSKELYENNPEIKGVLDMLRKDYFCPFDPGLFRPLFDLLFHEGDYYMHLIDFESYVQCQAKAAKEFQDRDLWIKKSISNVAKMGKFSSDRTISEYAKEIWEVKPVL